MASRQDASTGQIVSEESELGSDEFHLKVYAPYKVYFEGVVKSVSALNQTGPFDVLAQHHNFITLLSPYTLKIHTADNKDRQIDISKGIMQVKDNDVVVFLDV